MARGRGSKRGGGSRFAAVSAEEIELRNNRLAELDAARNRRRAEAAEEEEGGEGKEGEDENEENGGDNQEATAEQVGERVVEEMVMTRREREEKEKADATAAYRKRHEAGLTEEYKRDMAKLAEVKARRDEAERRKKADEEELLAAEEERKQKASSFVKNNTHEDDDNNDADDKKKKKKGAKEEIPKLDKIAIKKMKPAQLKEALKERNLDIQGNAKALLDRLLKFESER